MNAGSLASLGFNNMMHAIIINYYKWVALISFWGEKERKKHVGGKKEKKKNRAFARPSLELSPFMLSQLSNRVYQRFELTQRIGPQSVYVSRALCIVVLRSQ